MTDQNLTNIENEKGLEQTTGQEAFSALQPQALTGENFEAATSQGLLLGKRLAKESGLPELSPEAADEHKQNQPASTTSTSSQARRLMRIQPTHSPGTLQRTI